MNPKQKAIELINKFSLIGSRQGSEGVKCALIAIDEIIEEHKSESMEHRVQYWQEVKQEINNQL
jgi:hypothetical protein